MKNAANPIIEWKEIEQKVIDSFDEKNAGVIYALKQWKKEIDKIRNGHIHDEVIYHISSPRVLNAIVNYFKKVVKEHIKIFQLRIARQVRAHHADKIFLALRREGIFVDDDAGEKVVPELPGVIRIDEKKQLCQIVDATRQRALDKNDWESSAWPDDLRKKYSDYVEDMENFIEVNGDSACETYCVFVKIQNTLK